MKLAVWNMEWLNDLVVSSTATLKPGDTNVRGPRPPWANEGPTVDERLELLREGLEDMDPDILVVVEGPDLTTDLEAIMAGISDAPWAVYAQRSRYPREPGGPNIQASTQCIGIAVRSDRGLFSDPPFTVFDSEDPASGLVHEASKPFFYDMGRDKVTEWFRYERRPLYVEINPTQGNPFRILGLHLKSKGVFDALEWSQWWKIADSNRERLLAQCRQLREAFLDVYLRDDQTAQIPLIVCGDINDGPGFDTSEMRLLSSGIETLTGSIWKPHLALGNALFDGLSEAKQSKLDFRDLSTTRFADPIFNDTHHRVWIDHILYSRNAKSGWVKDAEIPRKTAGGTQYWKISDHFPVTATIDPTNAVS